MEISNRLHTLVKDSPVLADGWKLRISYLPLPGIEPQFFRQSAPSIVTVLYFTGSEYTSSNWLTVRDAGDVRTKTN